MILTLGMGALGAVLGLLVAWSASPVVATVMPLLFGLIGGAGSFSLLKADLTKPAAQKTTRALGASLLSCCSAFLVALVIGVSTRGYVEAMQSNALTYQLSADELANPASAIDRLLLRQRLIAIGASKSEIRSIMRADAKADFKGAADTIGQAVTALLAAHDQLSAADQQKVSEAPGFAKLISAARYFSIVKGAMDPNVPMTEEDFHLLTNNLYSINALTILPTDPAAAKSFTDHPALIAAVTNISEALWRTAGVADPSVRASEMDNFIKTATGPGAKPGRLNFPLADFKILPPPGNQ